MYAVHVLRQHRESYHNESLKDHQHGDEVLALSVCVAGTSGREKREGTED